MALLSVDRVSVSFGGLQALDDLTLEVPEGCVTGIVGPNGAGKSTLFNCVSGLLRPVAGDIRFDGVSLLGRPPHRRVELGIARGFQETRVLGRMTVLENVLVGARNVPDDSLWGAVRGGRRARIARAHATERARELLVWLGLGDAVDALANDLSYGQQKLLGLSQLLMTEPRMLMLDEPVAGVRAGLVDAIADRIREIVAGGRTVVLVEHNMPFVWSVCDVVHVLAGGRLIASGPPDVVSRDDEVVAAYLGRPTAERA